MITTSRSETKWVPIHEVIPNPLNPRKNDAIETEEITRILLSKGWEIPITVYQKGKYYIVLSGHRRLYAAKQTRTLKEIPIYIVEAPSDHQEEIERIASLQRGQVDWTAYEWGKFTYERWLAWGKPKFKDFAKKANMPQRTVQEYVQVLSYFPRLEIEDSLDKRRVSMSTLASLIDFINKLKTHKPQIVADLSEEMIRKILLKKAEDKFITRETLRTANSQLMKVWEEPEILEFFNTSNMYLQDVLNEHAIDNAPLRTLQGKLISFGVTNKHIKETDVPHKREEQEKLLRSLEQLQETIKNQIKNVKKVHDKE